jgi:hypothetical protein
MHAAIDDSSTAHNLDVCLIHVNGKKGPHFCFSHSSVAVAASLALSIHFSLSLYTWNAGSSLRIKSRKILALFDFSSTGWTFETSWWCNDPLSSLLSAMKISLSLYCTCMDTYTCSTHVPMSRPTCPEKIKMTKCTGCRWKITSSFSPAWKVTPAKYCYESIFLTKVERGPNKGQSWGLLWSCSRIRLASQ